MKCPLTFKTTRRLFRAKVLTGGDCLQKECEWWDNSNRACAIAQQAVTTKHLVAVLDKIMLRMPRDLAPRG